MVDANEGNHSGRLLEVGGRRDRVDFAMTAAKLRLDPVTGARIGDDEFLQALRDPSRSFSLDFAAAARHSCKLPSSFVGQIGMEEFIVGNDHIASRNTRSIVWVGISPNEFP